MTTLYELTDQYIGLGHMIEDGEFDQQTLTDTLDGIEGEIEIKAENILKLCQHWKSDKEAIGQEVKRLQARMKMLDNRDRSLRGYLRHNMSATGIKSISCPLFTITLAKGRPMVVIEDESALPYSLLVTTQRPNKATILAKLKAGENVPGAVLGTSAESLRVK